MDGKNLTKFCIHIIIDKIYVGIVKRHFLVFKSLLQSYVIIWFLHYILRINGHNLTKVCAHINIAKIYVGIITNHFSYVCNRGIVTNLLFSSRVLP